MSRVELAKIHSLTFYSDALTKGRRSDPIPQLTCIGGPCKYYQPEVINCKSLPGGTGVDVDWKCEADLPESLRFGKVEVSCEGWSKPGDPYVLKGSCGLKYRLVDISGTLHKKYSDHDRFKNSYDVSQIVFMFLWIGFLLVIVYSFINSCRVNRNGPRRTPRDPGPGYRPDTSGWFPGGNRPHDDSPPPPYSKTTPGTAAPAEAGWRPGFWTGAALGGLGSYLWNNRGNAAGDNGQARRYDWERPTAQSTGFWGASNRQPSHRSSNNDRGEGSSNLGSMRSSTGFGGSSVR